MPNEYLNLTKICEIFKTVKRFPFIMGRRKVVTQIGSLPYQDIDLAIEYSLKHDIPFLPELPKRGDAMFEYIKNPGKLSCLESFKKHKYDTVKVQCIGPATLLLFGYYDENDALLRVYEHVQGIMDGLKAKEVILFLDEPALGNAGFEYKPLWDPIFKAFDVTSGIHVCGGMDWDRLLDSDIEIISFDASRTDITIYPKYAEQRDKKRIAWGIEKKEDIKDFKKGDLITLPCGIGSPIYKVEDCDKKLETLLRIAEEIKAK